MKVWSQKNLEDIRHEYIDFDGEWYLAFGRPEKSGCWIIYGKSGQGKSSFALQLARKFDEMGLRVLIFRAIYLHKLFQKKDFNLSLRGI